jgi:hypothetical protein
MNGPRKLVTFCRNKNHKKWENIATNENGVVGELRAINREKKKKYVSL